MLGVELSASLEQLSVALEPAQDHWWIIGSVAVALHGGDPSAIADIDVILSERDARIVLPQLGLPLAAGPASDRFASKLFATWTAPSIPVEFMAGLLVCREDQWSAIIPTTRQTVRLPDADVFIPSLAELRSILMAFGRDKDTARLNALKGLG